VFFVKGTSETFNMYAKYSKMVDSQRMQTEKGGQTIEESSEENKATEESAAPPTEEAPADCGATTEKAQEEEAGTDAKDETGSDATQAAEAEPKLNLDQLWERLCNPPGECKSLLKKNLTQELLDSLRDKETKFGGRLEDCIRSGMLTRKKNITLCNMIINQTKFIFLNHILEVDIV
jgi:hypothetical protein